MITFCLRIKAKFLFDYSCGYSYQVDWRWRNNHTKQMWQSQPHTSSSAGWFIVTNANWHTMKCRPFNWIGLRFSSLFSKHFFWFKFYTDLKGKMCSNSHHHTQKDKNTSLFCTTYVHAKSPSFRQRRKYSSRSKHSLILSLIASFTSGIKKSIITKNRQNNIQMNQ